MCGQFSPQIPALHCFHPDSTHSVSHQSLMHLYSDRKEKYTKPSASVAEANLSAVKRFHTRMIHKTSRESAFSHTSCCKDVALHVQLATQSEQKHVSQQATCARCFTVMGLFLTLTRTLSRCQRQAQRSLKVKVGVSKSAQRGCGKRVASSGRPGTSICIEFNDNKQTRKSGNRTRMVASLPSLSRLQPFAIVHFQKIEI